MCGGIGRQDAAGGGKAWVVVAEFRDVIYPGLISTGTVSRAGYDRPWHTVINGENYHVLKALTWTHRGKIDALYIDPPYNSLAKDWKYNNDYVDPNDDYGHSMWLAMMERRLHLLRGTERRDRRGHCRPSQQPLG